jgi:predicted nuclease of restriction endonuclease-like (RecB) superfamily
MIKKNVNYNNWLTQLKQKVRNVQLKAVVSVNTELLKFYWELGSDIFEKQENSKWADKFLSNLSKDLLIEFPDMKGFSKRNLELIRQWVCFWKMPNTKQAVSQLISSTESIFYIPWGHNIAIMTKCSN